jgi:WD40 repeat protein
VTPQIRLKRDWDVPVQPPAPGKSRVGRFVGREPELDRLVNELLRSPHKAILVSGYRGVGKTSLVYEALNRVEKRSQENPSPATARLRLKSRGGGEGRRQFLYVLQNASQLDVGADAGIQPREILVNLIRRLYTASMAVAVDVELRESINRLYRKAVAAEVKLTQHDELKRETLAIRERERSVTLDVPKQGLARVLPWAAGLAAAAGLELAWATEDWQKLIALLAVPLGAVAVSATFRRSFRSSEASNALTSEYYEFDHSLGNLEFDLEQVHHELQERDIRTIYVIDELDKLDAQQVLDVLRFFKNLFTLSSAIFIFVGGEELSERFYRDADGSLPAAEKPVNDAPALYREKEYTYFTSKYVLARPLYADVAAFCEQACDGEVAIEAQEGFELFVRLVAFEARGDYFDLVQRIKDRITAFDGLSPVVELPTPDARDRARILLQQAVNVVFEERYRVERPSRWSENERVVRALYEFAHEILEKPSGAPFADPESDDLEAAAKRDLASLLARVGVLEQSESREETIRGLPVRFAKYVSTGRYPEALPASDYRTEIEQRFLREYSRCFGLVADLHDVASIVFDDVPVSRIERQARAAAIVAQVADRGGDGVPAAALNRYAPLFEALAAPGTPSAAYRREELELASTSLIAAREQLAGHTSEVLARFLGAAREGIEVRAVGERFPREFGEVPSGDVSLTAGPDGRELLIGVALPDDLLKQVTEIVAGRSRDRLRVALSEPDGDDAERRLPTGMTALPPLERSPWALGAVLRRLADWLVGRTALESIEALRRTAERLRRDDAAYPGATASVEYVRFRLAHDELGEAHPATQAALDAANRFVDRSWTELHVLRGHDGWVTRGGFVRDGSILFTGSRDGTTRLWDVETGAELRVLAADQHKAAVRGPTAPSPDGRLLATGGVARIAVWELETARQVIAFDQRDAVNDLQFTADGAYMVSGSYGGLLQVWDWRSGELVHELDHGSSRINQVACSPDGDTIAAASEGGTAGIWSTASWKLVTRLEHSRPVEGVAFSPDGALLVTACDDSKARVWRAGGVEPIDELDGEGLALTAQFSPDGQLIVVGYSTGSASVWSAVTYDRLAVLEGHTDWIRYAVFSPDSSQILTVSDDGRAIVWRPRVDRAALRLSARAAGSA